MRNFLIVVALFAVTVAILPAIQERLGAQRFTHKSPAVVSTPTATGGTYRSELGASGGLGTASMKLSQAGRFQVYTLKSLQSVPPGQYNGQVIRLRLSKPKFSTSVLNGATYTVSFIDQDLGGGATIKFPKEGAERLDLIERTQQPGLTFYVALDQFGLRAVGRDWREDLQTYTW